MSTRATWKGLLKISLVAIPIKVFPATEASETLSFNQLHEACQTRMQQKRWCAQCQREVPASEIVKGFEFEKGRYVILLDAELEAVKPDSTRVIELTQFADATELQPYSIDRSYYLAPDGERAAEAFAVMRQAMATRVGIGKLAIYGREYLVAVRPTQVSDAGTVHNVLMLHTLHHAAEIRSVEAIEELQVVTAVVPAQVRLARQVIAAFVQPLDLADFTDAYQADLRRLIDAKVAGEDIVEPAAVEPLPVLPLRAALEQSLAEASAAKTRHTRAAAPKRKSVA